MGLFFFLFLFYPIFAICFSFSLFMYVFYVCYLHDSAAVLLNSKFVFRCVFVRCESLIRIFVFANIHYIRWGSRKLLASSANTECVPYVIDVHWMICYMMFSVSTFCWRPWVCSHFQKCEICVNIAKYSENPCGIMTTQVLKECISYQIENY